MKNVWYEVDDTRFLHDIFAAGPSVSSEVHYAVEKVVWDGVEDALMCRMVKEEVLPVVAKAKLSMRQNACVVVYDSVLTETQLSRELLEKTALYAISTAQRALYISIPSIVTKTRLEICIV